jgi:type IV pilus assembly protein PilW
MRFLLSPTSRPASRGMSMIEVLVGLAVGMIGMLVIFQTVTVWDARTRVSASNGDNQVAGSLAMFRLERDLKLAGMGFGGAGSAELGCTVQAFDNTASGTAPFTLSPVVITDGDPRGVPDTLQVLYGNSPFFVEAEEFTNGTASTLATTLKYGFKRGDLAVMTDKSSNCRLLEITDDTTPDDHQLSFTTDPYTSFYTNAVVPQVRWNSATASMPTFSTGNLYSMGPSPQRNEWSVTPGSATLGFINRLSIVDVNQFFPVAEGVIDMKLQYGYDTDSDKRISDAEWTKVVPVDWTKVLAVRVALLVRGRDFQKPPSSDPNAPRYRLSAPPTWASGTKTFAMKNVDGTPDTDVVDSPNNWRYYRYRVYEKVIPLRNVIWGQS